MKLGSLAVVVLLQTVPFCSELPELPTNPFDPPSNGGSGGGSSGGSGSRPASSGVSLSFSGSKAPGASFTMNATGGPDDRHSHWSGDYCMDPSFEESTQNCRRIGGRPCSGQRECSFTVPDEVLVIDCQPPECFLPPGWTNPVTSRVGRVRVIYHYWSVSTGARRESYTFQAEHP